MKTTPIRHVLTTFLSLLLAMTTVVAQDSGTGWSYNPDTRTLTLSGGSVDWDAFKDYNEKTAHVIFAPSFSVSEIPSYAFSYFPKLKQIEIPNCVTTIGEGAFSSCYDLASITLPYTLQSIGDRAFNYSYALKKVTLLSNPKATEPHVIYLGSDNTSDKTATGNNVFYFYDCQPTLMYDPDKTYIGDENTDNNLRHYFSKLAPSTTNTNKGWSYNPNDSTLTLSGSEIAWHEFADYTYAVNRIVFANDFSITEIPTEAFYKFQELAKIELPDCVTSIDDAAFKGCEALASITFPSTLQSIGGSAFYLCDAIKKVVLLSDPKATEPHVIYLGSDNTSDKTATGGDVFPTRKVATLMYDPDKTYIGDEGTTDNLRYYFSDVSDISTFTPAPAPTSLTLPAPTALPVRYYDLNGRKVSPQTHRGLIIKTQGNRSTLTLTK